MRGVFKIFLTAAVILVAAIAGRAASLTNLAYRVDSTATDAVVVTELASGVVSTFQPNFRVVYSPTNTGYKQYDSNVQVTEYNRAGFYPMVWNGEPDFFKAPGTNYQLTASTSVWGANFCQWVFAGTNGIGVSARITLPAGTGEPLLTFDLTIAAGGYYSLGYVGAPERATNEVDWMWQPLLWSGKRFPSVSFFTPESECSIPAVLTVFSNQTVGLAVDLTNVYSPYNDPGERLLDTTSGYPGNFGVVLRSESGGLRPMVFAPVYGYTNLAPASTVSLAVRLVVRQGQWYDAHRHLATALYGFGDYRTNAICSLNTTLDNMQDFIQGPYGSWFSRYKAWDYLNDKPGWGRQQSAADAVSLALIKDDPALFTNIARPTVEYMLSRSGSLFPLADTNAPPNSAMGGWIEDTYGYGGADLTSVYQLSGRRCTVIHQRLQPTLRTTSLTGASNLSNQKRAMGELLSNYRLTGNTNYLNAARVTATNYISLRLDQPPTGAADAEGSFFIFLAPGWQLMNEMYDETGDPVFRDALVRSLREFTAFNFVIPPSNPGNIIVTNFLTGLGESVPAWRVDARGLMREAAATMHSHAGVFMAPFASYMLRAAQYTNDTFLRDIGRAAVVGRYASYPGYAYRRQLTHSYEQAAWPLQNYSVIRNYITMHYNHPLPMATYVLEFLVADAEARSEERIKFPSCFSWTGAYFIHKVYGAATGRFYGDTNVFLWLPQSLITNSTVQLNHLAGYGNGNFYLALMNQSSNAVTAEIAINRNRVNVAGSHGVRIIADNVVQPATNIVDGVMTVAVSGMGITALVISNAPVTTALQQLFYESDSTALPTSCFQIQTNTPVGKVGGQLLSFGPRLTSAFVWIDSDTNSITEATLNYETNGVWNTQVKTQFPFEFTVPLADNGTAFRYYVAGRTPAGDVVSNSIAQLGWQLIVQFPHGPDSTTTSTLYNSNQSVTVTVPASFDTDQFHYLCTGWAMTGHAPAGGTNNTVTFSLTNNATLAWLWDAHPLPVVNNGAGVAGVTAYSAWLQGNLIATGAAPATVFFHWGMTDGGTNPAAWATSLNLGTQTSGAFSNRLQWLVPNTDYYYRAHATNADADVWAATSATFRTREIQPAGYQLQFMFTNYNRAATLTNFPVLVVLGPQLGGFSYGQFLYPDAQDLRFKDETRTQFLNHEVVRWNTNGNSYIWVQVPELRSNTCIWASWGDWQDSEFFPSRTNGATWSNGYAAVWHFTETPGGDNVIRDSSANLRHGVASNLLAADQVTGLAGGALNFDGATKFVALNSEIILPASSAFTLGAWVCPVGTSGIPGITAPTTPPGYNNSLRLYNDNKPRFSIGGSSKLFNTVTSRDGTNWSSYTVTRTSGSPGVYTLYQNGTNDTGTATTSTTAFPIAYLGRGMETNDSSRNWKGGLAEIRVSSVERSSNWVWAEWVSMAASQTFAQAGLVTTNPPLAVQLTGQNVGLNSVVLSWRSLSNWTYVLERATNPAGTFQSIWSNAPATPPQNVFTDNIVELPRAFYRVKGNTHEPN